MEIKLVKRPLQDEHTKPEEVQFPNEKWCVKTSMYREGVGGMTLWFKEIERVNPDVIYLYEIKSWKFQIVLSNIALAETVPIHVCSKYDIKVSKSLLSLSLPKSGIVYLSSS